MAPSYCTRYSEAAVRDQYKEFSWKGEGLPNSLNHLTPSLTSRLLSMHDSEQEA